MTITVQVTAFERSLPDLLARVEAGEEVIVARGDAPIVRVTRILPSGDVNRSDTARAIAEIRQIRAGIAPTTIEDILSWRDEGRR